MPNPIRQMMALKRLYSGSGIYDIDKIMAFTDMLDSDKRKQTLDVIAEALETAAGPEKEFWKKAHDTISRQIETHSTDVDTVVTSRVTRVRNSIAWSNVQQTLGLQEFSLLDRDRLISHRDKAFLDEYGDGMSSVADRVVFQITHNEKLTGLEADITATRERIRATERAIQQTKPFENPFPAKGVKLKGQAVPIEAGEFYRLQTDLAADRAAVEDLRRQREAAAIKIVNKEAKKKLGREVIDPSKVKAWKAKHAEAQTIAQKAIEKSSAYKDIHDPQLAAEFLGGQTEIYDVFTQANEGVFFTPKELKETFDWEDDLIRSYAEYAVKAFKSQNEGFMSQDVTSGDWSYFHGRHIKTSGDRHDEILKELDRVAEASSPIKFKPLTLEEAAHKGVLADKDRAALALELFRRRGDDYASGALGDLSNVMRIVAGESTEPNLTINVTRPPGGQKMMQAIARNELSKRAKYTLAEVQTQMIGRSAGALRGDLSIARGSLMGKTPAVLEGLQARVEGMDLFVPHTRMSGITYRDMSDTAEMLFSFVQADKTSEYQFKFTAEALKEGFHEASSVDDVFQMALEDATENFGIKVSGRMRHKFLSHAMGDSTNQDFIDWVQSEAGPNGIDLRGMKGINKELIQLRKSTKKFVNGKVTSRLKSAYGLTDKEAKDIAPHLLRLARLADRAERDSSAAEHYERELALLVDSGDYDSTFGKIARGYAKAKAIKMAEHPGEAGLRLTKKGGILDSLIGSMIEDTATNEAPTGQTPLEYLAGDVFMDFAAKVEEQVPTVTQNKLLKSKLFDVMKDSLVDRVVATKHMSKDEVESLSCYIDAVRDGSEEAMKIHGQALGEDTKTIVDFMVGNLQNTADGKMSYFASVLKRTAHEARQKAAPRAYGRSAEYLSPNAMVTRAFAGASLVDENDQKLHVVRGGFADIANEKVGPMAALKSNYIRGFGRSSVFRHIYRVMGYGEYQDREVSYSRAVRRQMSMRGRVDTEFVDEATPVLKSLHSELIDSLRKDPNSDEYTQGIIALLEENTSRISQEGENARADLHGLLASVQEKALCDAMGIEPDDFNKDAMDLAIKRSRDALSGVMMEKHERGFRGMSISEAMQQLDRHMTVKGTVSASKSIDEEGTQLVDILGGEADQVFNEFLSRNGELDDMTIDSLVNAARTNKARVAAIDTILKTKTPEQEDMARLVGIVRHAMDDPEWVPHDTEDLMEKVKELRRLSVLDAGVARQSATKMAEHSRRISASVPLDVIVENAGDEGVRMGRTLARSRPGSKVNQGEFASYVMDQMSDISSINERQVKTIAEALKKRAVGDIMLEKTGISNLISALHGEEHTRDLLEAAAGGSHELDRMLIEMIPYTENNSDLLRVMNSRILPQLTDSSGARIPLPDGSRITAAQLHQSEAGQIAEFHVQTPGGEHFYTTTAIGYDVNGKMLVGDTTTQDWARMTDRVDLSDIRSRMRLSFKKGGKLIGEAGDDTIETINNAIKATGMKEEEIAEIGKLMFPGLDDSVTGRELIYGLSQVSSSKTRSISSMVGQAATEHGIVGSSYGAVKGDQLTAVDMFMDMLGMWKEASEMTDEELGSDRGRMMLQMIEHGAATISGRGVIGSELENAAFSGLRTTKKPLTKVEQLHRTINFFRRHAPDVDKPKVIDVEELTEGAKAAQAAIGEVKRLRDMPFSELLEEGARAFKNPVGAAILGTLAVGGALAARQAFRKPHPIPQSVSDLEGDARISMNGTGYDGTVMVDRSPAGASGVYSSGGHSSGRGSVINVDDNLSSIPPHEIDQMLTGG